jgi:hypothetical protein
MKHGENPRSDEPIRAGHAGDRRRQFEEERGLPDSSELDLDQGMTAGEDAGTEAPSGKAEDSRPD